MRFLVCFDISDDKKRKQLVDTLLGYGKRCQCSVFEMQFNQTIYKKFLNDVKKFTFELDDKLFIYPIPNENNGTITRYGQYIKDQEVFVF